MLSDVAVNVDESSSTCVCLRIWLAGWPTGWIRVGESCDQPWTEGFVGVAILLGEEVDVVLEKRKWKRWECGVVEVLYRTGRDGG